MLLYNKILLIIILILSLAKQGYQNHHNTDTLVLVQVIFRHGERTPQRTYPNDIYKNETYSPYGFGELTNKGKSRMYDIGLSLRQRYDRFLGAIYNQSTVEAKSSSYTRTRMSCELVLAGLFQPSSAEKWNAELNWQPTICDYAKAEEDYMFLSEKNCKVLPLKGVQIEGDRIMGKFKKYAATFEYFSNKSGLKMETPADVTPLYDILRCQNEMGMHLPNWTHNVFPYPLSNLSIIDWDYSVKTEELKRLGGGVLFKTMVDNIKKKVAHDPDHEYKKMYIYSGHDSNIVPILAILGIYEKKIMGYGTTIIMEVHQINKNHIVKVFLQGGDTWNPKYMSLPGCEKNCTLYKFLKAYEKYFATKEMCM